MSSRDAPIRTAESLDQTGDLADVLVMGEVTVVRWTRYGKDRFYVKDAEGRDLGWADATTRAVTATTPESAARVAAAVAAHLGGATTTPAPPLPPPASPTPPPAAETAEPQRDPNAASGSWHDLAENVPGQAARARADEEVAAMRERSRVGTWLARALDVKTDERAWRVGADGEERIGAKLEKLHKEGWHVLHSVPVGTRGSDIDHVLIGRGGVFTLNTKRHPGKKVWVGGSTVIVDGHKVPYIRNSEFEADRAARLLSEAVGFPVAVTPVLVFTTGTLIPDVTIKRRPDRVVVLDRMDVPGVFKRARPILEAAQVDVIYSAARRSTTWMS